ncbi:MAG: hypothetical protein ACYTFI_19945, partial [Planctomycetota bacterium]
MGIWVLAGLGLLSALSTRSPAGAADWPQWRCDAARSASSDGALAAELHLQWVRDFPPPRPAWPKEPVRLSFDATYEPIALGDRVYMASMVEDCVTALDAASGQEKWRFFAG